MRAAADANMMKLGDIKWKDSHTFAAAQQAPSWHKADVVDPPGLCLQLMPSRRQSLTVLQLVAF